MNIKLNRLITGIQLLLIFLLSSSAFATDDAFDYSQIQTSVHIIQSSGAKPASYAKTSFSISDLNGLTPHLADQVKAVRNLAPGSSRVSITATGGDSGDIPPIKSLNLCLKDSKPQSLLQHLASLFSGTSGKTILTLNASELNQIDTLPGRIDPSCSSIALVNNEVLPFYGSGKKTTSGLRVEIFEFTLKGEESEKPEKEPFSSRHQVPMWSADGAPPPREPELTSSGSGGDLWDPKDLFPKKGGRPFFGAGASDTGIGIDNLDTLALGQFLAGEVVLPEGEWGPDDQAYYIDDGYGQPQWGVISGAALHQLLQRCLGIIPIDSIVGLRPEFSIVNIKDDEAFNIYLSALTGNGPDKWIVQAQDFPRSKGATGWGSSSSNSYRVSSFASPCGGVSGGFGSSGGGFGGGGDQHLGTCSFCSRVVPLASLAEHQRQCSGSVAGTGVSQTSSSKKSKRAKLLKLAEEGSKDVLLAPVTSTGQGYKMESNSLALLRAEQEFWKTKEAAEVLFEAVSKVFEIIRSPDQLSRILFEMSLYFTVKDEDYSIPAHEYLEWVVGAIKSGSNGREVLEYLRDKQKTKILGSNGESMRGEKEAIVDSNQLVASVAVRAIESLLEDEDEEEEDKINWLSYSRKINSGLVSNKAEVISVSKRELTSRDDLVKICKMLTSWFESDQFPIMINPIDLIELVIMNSGLEDGKTDTLLTKARQERRTIRHMGASLAGTFSFLETHEVLTAPEVLYAILDHDFYELATDYMPTENVKEFRDRVSQKLGAILQDWTEDKMFSSIEALSALILDHYKEPVYIGQSQPSSFAQPLPHLPQPVAFSSGSISEGATSLASTFSQSSFLLKPIREREDEILKGIRSEYGQAYIDAIFMNPNSEFVKALCSPNSKLLNTLWDMGIIGYTARNYLEKSSRSKEDKVKNLFADERYSHIFKQPDRIDSKIQTLVNAFEKSHSKTINTFQYLMEEIDGVNKSLQ